MLGAWTCSALACCFVSIDSRSTRAQKWVCPAAATTAEHSSLLRALSLSASWSRHTYVRTASESVGGTIQIDPSHHEQCSSVPFESVFDLFVRCVLCCADRNTQQTRDSRWIVILEAIPSFPIVPPLFGECSIEFVKHRLTINCRMFTIGVCGQQCPCEECSDCRSSLFHWFGEQTLILLVHCAQFWDWPWHLVAIKVVAGQVPPSMADDNFNWN